MTVGGNSGMLPVVIAKCRGSPERSTATSAFGTPFTHSSIVRFGRNGGPPIVTTSECMRLLRKPLVISIVVPYSKVLLRENFRKKLTLAEALMFVVVTPLVCKKEEATWSI